MASDERKITIELKAIGADDSGDDGSGKDEDKKEKAAKNAQRSALKQIGKFAVRQATTEALFEFERYTTLSENYKFEVMIGNAQTALKKTMALGSSIMSGLTTAVMIPGPAGAILGSLIAAEFVVTEVLSLSRQYRQQDLQLATDDRTASYARSRLGLIDNGRGTQN